MRWMRVGEPIWIGVEVRNVSDDERAVAGITPYSYDITVTRNATDTKLTPLPNFRDHWDALHVVGGTLALHTGWSSYGGIRVDRLVPITEAGSYTVRVLLSVSKIFTLKGAGESFPATTLVSNGLVINVLPVRSTNPLPGADNGVGEGSQGKTLAGRAVKGFVLSLSMDPFDVALVELRNVSSGAGNAVFDPRTAYEFNIKNLRTGQMVRVASGAPHDLRSTPLTEQNIYPDTSLYAAFNLKKMYGLNGDRYRIFVTSYPVIAGGVEKLVSNTIEVKIPATKPMVPLKRSVTAVLGVAIESNRPVYVAGGPVLLRASFANKTNDSIIIWGLDPSLIATSRDGGCPNSSAECGRRRLR